MNSLLAYADSSDATQTTFIVLLLCIAGIVGICFLVGLLVLLSRRHERYFAERIGTAAVFWGIIASGNIIYVTVTQVKWKQQHYQDLLTGYANLQESAPSFPWVLWTALIIVFAVLLVMTISRRT
jgi:hypothetical protein